MPSSVGDGGIVAVGVGVEVGCAVSVAATAVPSSKAMAVLVAPESTVAECMNVAAAGGAATSLLACSGSITGMEAVAASAWSIRIAAAVAVRSGVGE
jgi:hypothetical protein